MKPVLSPSPGRLALACCVALGVLALEASAGSLEQGDRFALVIGIDDYQTLGKLKVCRNDAKAVARVLVEAAGYPQKRVLLLTDDAEASQNRPTLATMKRRISQVATLAGKRDTLLVYFSGHGITRGGKGYLVPMDGDPQNAVSLAWVKDTLAASPAASKVLILDACHSGSAAKGVGGIAPSLVAGAKDFVMLLSSAADQVSYPDEEGTHSVFSKYLVEGLSGAADADKDRRITQAELFAHVRRGMTDWCLKTGRMQTPMALPDVAGAVVLARLGQMQAWRHPSTEVAARVPSWAKVGEFQIQGARKAGVPVAKELDLGGGETMRFVYIPPGTFMMGSSMSPAEVARRYGGEAEYFDDEDQHRVRLTKGFYMGVTEVTQAQWRVVMRSEPWSGEKYAKAGDENAASYVTWDDASAFCKALSRKANVSVRLPTEAEWEYACWAGTTTAYSFGDDVSALNDYAWYADNAWEAGEKYAHPVGRKKPNAWGLYDMHGNVWEWCGDWHGEYPNGAVTDPTGPASGEYRLLRGGSWGGHRHYCRSARRYGGTPDLRNIYLGFRVALLPFGVD